ncbi:MAG: ABC transporter substrate-binding protein, partial [Candidatus Thorarchaeota archaeon]
MRKRGLFFVIIILSMLLNSQTPLLIINARKASIKIGVLGPLEISVGKDMEAGAKLAVKEINAAGGVTVGGLAYDLELLVETTSDPATGLPNDTVGVTSVKKLQEQDDVSAMLGLFRKEVALAVMAELDRPFLGVAASAPIITPYFWRVGPSNGTQLARSLLDFYNYGLGQQQGVRNVTIVRQDAGWALAMSSAMKMYLGGGLLGIDFDFTDDIVLAEDASFEAVNGSLAPLENEYQGLNVNALMPIFAGAAGKHITEAWASLNLAQYLAGINVGAQSDSYFEETEGSAYGEIELESTPPDINSTTKTHLFRAGYWIEYGEKPSLTAFTSYDAVYVIKDALERADSTNAADLQAVLATTDFEGAAYTIRFTSELGSQNDTAADGSKVPVPGAPTGITVHDAYSEFTVYKIDETYIRGYYVQWQQGGVKKTVWTRPGETV